MEVEEQLEILKSKANLCLAAHKREPSPLGMPPWVEEELWLLELVVNEDFKVKSLNELCDWQREQIGQLQGQVKRLVADIAQCRDKYDGNHD